MVLTVKLDNWIKRIAVIVVLFISCAGLGWLTISHFITNTLSDESVVILRSTLFSAAAYFPQSSRLQARLAKVELAEVADETDLARAESAALHAVRLSPWNSNNQLLLASVRNLQGDLDATEIALRAAVKLAPNSAQAHWQLANLLVRQDRVDDAIQEFRRAVTSDVGSVFLPGTMDVVWNISEGNAEKLTQVVGNDPAKRLLLAQFLLKQSRLPDAVGIYKSIEQSALLATPATTEFLNSLIAIGQLELAKDLWTHLSTADKSVAGQLLHNGGFEKEIVPALSQFDWKISHSEYAILSLDTAVTHSGKRSLRINLTGRDTTVLGKELHQIVVVKPGVRYRLEWYAKTDKLITTEAIHIVVADGSTLVATSNPITTGTSDWQSYSLDFVASTKAKALAVMIKRTPRFSYDEPSKGSIWFDDFTLTETVSQK
jgi:tetratricopeptide (TPR) repeat protein